MYTDCTSRVKWTGLLYDTIDIQQGVRQGGVLSTSHYKRYNNPLLLHLEGQYTEVRIGCGDDLAGLTRRHRDMQVMVWDIENNTERERYCANPNKSSYLCFNIPKHETQGIELVMSGEKNPLRGVHCLRWNH